MSTALNTIINQEIQTITNTNTSPVHYQINATLHVMGKDGGGYNIPILGVVSLDSFKDYVNNFSDVINININLTAAVLLNEVHVNKENLEMTVSLYPLHTSAQFTQNNNVPNRSYRYKAVLLVSSSPLVEGNVDELLNIGSDSSNRADVPDSMVTVGFQLVDPMIIKTRNITVGTIVKNASGIDIIRYFLTKNYKEYKQMKGVDVVDGFNAQLIPHTPIPHGTKLINLPRHVNEQTGGIYPTGFGYYLQPPFWYIYPLYNLKLFETSERTLTIINVPDKTMNGTERTFRVTENQIVVLSTAKVKHVDTTESERYNAGSVSRFINTNKIVDGFGVNKNNQFKIDSRQNITELKVNPSDDKTTKENLASPHANVITNAANLEYSKLAEQNGSKIVVTWEHSDDSYLYPAMPVRFMFVSNGTVKQLYGTLLFVDTHTTSKNLILQDRKFFSTTILSCFVGKDISNRSVQ